MKKFLFSIFAILSVSSFAQGPVRQIPTIADLSSINAQASAVSGKLSVLVADTGRVLHWDSGSALSVDNGCVFSASSGRFIAADCSSGTISVKWFGATGDGLTDDTAAVIAARSAAITFSAVVYFPAGYYLVSSVVLSGPRIEPRGYQPYIAGTLIVSNLVASNSITLGGETRTTWPTGGGGGGIDLVGVAGDVIYHAGTNWTILHHPGTAGNVLGTLQTVPTWASFDSGDINFLSAGTPFTNITTAARLALSLTTSNIGHFVFDTDLKAVMAWSGTNWVGFPIATPWAVDQPEKEYFIVSCALRQNTTNRARWDYITNSTHRPLNVGGDFAIASSNRITLTFGRSFTRAVALTVFPDETFAGGANVSFGAQVTATNATLSAGSFFAGSYVLRYTGAAWSVTSVSGSDIQPAVSSYVNGVLRITNDYIRGNNIALSAWSSSGGNYGYIPMIRGTGVGYVDLEWLDPTTGLIVTSASPLWRMTAAITQKHWGPLDLDGSNSSDSLLGEDTSVGGNIWVFGLFEK